MIIIIIINTLSCGHECAAQAHHRHALGKAPNPEPKSQLLQPTSEKVSFIKNAAKVTSRELPTLLMSLACLSLVVSVYLPAGL